MEQYENHFQIVQLNMKPIEKAFDILEVFLKQRGKIGIVELADVTKLNVSTAHRIVSILVKRGYLSQSEKKGKYSLSPKLLEFGFMIKRELKIGDVASPFLDELNRMVNESVNLVILENKEAVYVKHIAPSHMLQMFTKAGARVPLHSTGVGKVFLAYMGEKELQKFLNSKGLPFRTRNTITDFSRLKDELAIIRREGTAIDDEENELGVKCVAAPVKDATGNVIAAISISGPSARLDNNRVQELGLLVKSCALKISRRIGYR